MKLWFDTPDEMRAFSNKRPQLIELFQWMDYKKLNRIDSLVLFAAIIMAIEGKEETISNNIMLFLGLKTQKDFINMNSFSSWIACLRG